MTTLVKGPKRPPPPTRPWISGFCNPNNDKRSHGRCHGSTDDGVICACPTCKHYQSPTETPMETPGLAETVDACVGDLPSGYVVLALEEGDRPEVRLAETVEALVAVGALLNEESMDGTPATDWQDAVRLLDRLREASDHIGFVVASLTKHVYLTGEHGDQTIEGLGRVKIARGRDRRAWDERGVARAVIDAKMEQRGFEVPDNPWDVAEWLLETMAMNYARVTSLRALGLEPKDYCTDTPGRIGVSLPPR